MHDLTATKFVCHVCSDRSGLTTTFARWRGAPTTAPQLSSYLRALIEKPRLRANRARDEAAAGQLETRHRSRKHPTSVIGVPKAGPKRGGDAPAKSRHPNVRDGGLAGAAIIFSIEGNLLTLAKAAQAGALQRCGMDENVLAAAVRLDESEAFLFVVELYGAVRHGRIPLTG